MPAPDRSEDRLDVRLARWAERCIDLGWLGEDARGRLAPLRDAGAADLFAGEERPLVAGLFGGTGVGKSSLLNRFAGQGVARVSAERPTSRGVTAYLHRSRSLDALPAEFPLERLHTAVHHEPRWRDVLWIDMPDVDSVETSHVEQVRAWLPHLDVVLYVASPERYRDDRGWQLLREHAAGHAWLFVMNQWDRGDARQLEDWRAQLAAAGFADPMLFRTVAGGGTLPDADGPRGADVVQDDFTALEGTLAGLADRALIDALERHGTLARLERLLDVADDLEAASLGPRDATAGDAVVGPLPHDAALEQRWQAHWPTLRDGTAGALAARMPALVAAAGERGGALEGAAAGERLFDDGARERLASGSRRVAQDASAAGELPRAVARRLFDPQVDSALDAAPARIDAAVGTALATPGTRWQRALHRTALVGATLLPLAALGWAGVRVVDAFRRGGSDPAAYLGSAFAITAALLVALAWALPWWLARQVRPSPLAALARGLSTGIDHALDGIDDAVRTALEAIARERSSLADALDEVRRSAAQRLLPLRDGAAATADERVPVALRRLLAGPRAGGPGAGSGEPRQSDPADGAGVRATTQSVTLSAPVS